MGATDGIAYVNGEFAALYEDGSSESLGFVVAPWWLKNPSDGYEEVARSASHCLMITSTGLSLLLI